MSKNRLMATGVSVAVGLCGTLAGASVVLHNDAVEVVGAGAVADPLIAVEANRAAIINRLAVQFGEAATQAGVHAETFRGVLSGLRADQLLAAALVGSFAELTAIVTQPPSDGALLQRFVAVTPMLPQSFSELPFAQAYLTRDGDALTVTRARDLRLGETSVVGYFTSSGVVVSGVGPTPKDGPGLGTNSWIGYIAGSNLANGNGSAVAAGTFNAALGQGSFIGAGSSNVASGISSLVIGGFDNQATAIDSLVGAGAGHRATGARSVVVGGGYNLASGQWSFIGGGGRQTASGAAAGAFAEDNVASGNFSVVTGGQGNRTTSNFATVPGGRNNLASGQTSFAAGQRAKTQTAGGAPVVHDGTFAFADGSAFDFNTAAANEFAVRSTGGVRFVTQIDGAGLPTKTLTLAPTGTLGVAGNLDLVSSSATAGNITKSGSPFLHNFGGSNTFLGVAAGNFSMTGGNNTATGVLALSSNAAGHENTATGVLALQFNTAGYENTATGAFALGNNTLGAQNTAIGVGALGTNDVGSRNTATGVNALVHNTTGSDNTASGFNALFSNTSAGGNTATGSGALQNNTTGSFNTAYGASALLNNTLGIQNTATGTSALGANTTGNFNAANGTFALTSNTTGVSNTASGHTALYSNTTGSNNVAAGMGALVNNTTGSSNVAMGSGASGLNVTGMGNTAIGTNSLTTNTGGVNNTAIGNLALGSNTGDTNIAIGASAGINLNSGSFNIYVAHAGFAGENNTMRIGSGQGRAFVAGIRGTVTGVNDAVAVVVDSAGQLGTISSSRRFKDDIADMSEASAGLMKLRPVTFRYKAHASVGERALHYGLVAEEVAAVYPGMVARSADGQIETVKYQFLPPMLLNEYQKQQRTIVAQAYAIHAQALRLAELEQDRVIQNARIADQAAETAELRHAVEILLARTLTDANVATAR